MSDLERACIKMGLPNKMRGKKQVDARRVINGIFYVLRSGIPWADLPDQYGSHTMIYNRSTRWSDAGHRDRIMDASADV
jgi:transposase